MKRLGAVAALVLVAGCSSVGPTSPIPTTFASPTPTLAPTATAVSPSASLPASQVPSVGPDEAKALDLATRYETARAAGNWSEAWGLLSDRSQAVIGSLAAFETGEIAYNASGGAVFVIQPPTQDAELLANFLGASQAEIAQQADLTRGYLVFVQHPQVKAASAGTTGLLVAPLVSGDWKIWLVH